MTAASLRQLTAALLLSNALLGGNAACAEAPPGECPPILSASEIEAGQKGTGWTVVEGDSPQPFAVTILGVQTNGIAPGHDLAIIELADRPGSHFIAEAGGVWAGMSGSPVYIDGKLAGAVSYTFSQGPSTIGGMTLAEDMMEVLSFDEPVGADAAVTLTTESRHAVAEHLGASLDSVGTSFSRLPIPIVASGIAASGLADLATTLEARGVHGFLIPGSTAAAPSAQSEFRTPVPGGNFAAVVSYGDVTVGGIGTTTYVCGDRALAFGHPLAQLGATTFGANDATAFAIVKDPTLGPFKIASIGSSFGLVDQDRTAALGATLGAMPGLIPITARLRSIALDRERFGVTYVTMSEFVRRIATSHLLDDVLAVTDTTGGGSALLRWKIRGTRSDGRPWEIRRANRITARDDIGLAAAIALLADLVSIDENIFEDVAFGGIAITGRISPVARQDRIVGASVSKSGGAFQDIDELAVAPGDELEFRIGVRKPNSRLHFVRTTLVVPSDAGGSGTVVVADGRQSGLPNCYSFPDSCAQTFPGLLEAMAAAPRWDDVVVDLVFSSDYSRHVQARARNRAVVSGRFSYNVTAVGAATTTTH